MNHQIIRTVCAIVVVVQITVGLFLWYKHIEVLEYGLWSISYDIAHQ